MFLWRNQRKPSTALLICLRTYQIARVYFSTDCAQDRLFFLEICSEIPQVTGSEPQEEAVCVNTGVSAFSRCLLSFQQFIVWPQISCYGTGTQASAQAGVYA